jgi:H+/Cl- antiporter ClcA
MRMSASMCLILMEMTGAPTTLPFLMMVLVIAKGVGDRFNYRWGSPLPCPLQRTRS